MATALVVCKGGGVRSVCVFCGSSFGRRPEYSAAVRQLAHALVAAEIDVVYGGARVGTMGLLADTALEAGGRVIGVIPGALVDAEVAHGGLTELHVVGSMHERKARMAELADGFIALPGGLGTLDELAEIITWSQLGLHDKPTALLNVAGYYDDLLAFFDHAVEEGYLLPQHRSYIHAETDVHRLLEVMAEWVPVSVRKWVDSPPSLSQLLGDTVDRRTQ
jgi:uncharacterized protein (TIGR00730 family)